jgi:diguanylate cyclase (GGDEF)-like protein
MGEPILMSDGADDIGCLQKAIDESVAANEYMPSSAALLVICISNLPIVKDRIGVQAAKIVSTAVEKRLKKVLRSSDAIGRLSEGQFGIVLSRCRPDKIPTAARRFLAAATSARVVINDTAVEVMLSVASVAFPDEALTSCDAVIAQAETRLQEARGRAPTVVRFNGGQVLNGTGAAAR